MQGVHDRNAGVPPGPGVGFLTLEFFRTRILVEES